MSAAKNGGDRSWDPIYGRGGSGWGRAGAAFARLRDCVRLIRDEEFPDATAVEMVREAAGNQRSVLPSFAEAFIGREWYGDPLLTRVADLVRAAERGQPTVSPLDPATAQVVGEERRLLKLSPADVFAELAARQPGLHDWARRGRDPEWRAAQDMNPVPPPSPDATEVAPGVWASKSTPKVGTWLIGLLVRRSERGRSKRLGDPRWAEFERSADEARSRQGTMYALTRELDRLVGPHAETADPLVKTYVALAFVTPYAFEVAGIQRPSPPPLWTV